MVTALLLAAIAFGVVSLFVNAAVGQVIATVGVLLAIVARIIDARRQHEAQLEAAEDARQLLRLLAQYTGTNS